MIDTNDTKYTIIGTVIGLLVTVFIGGLIVLPPVGRGIALLVAIVSMTILAVVCEHRAKKGL